MEFKLMCLLIFLLGLALNHVGADFFYNPYPFGPTELEDRGLKCMPGRTVLKFDKKQDNDGYVDDDDEESDMETRREHMSKKTKDTSCRVCVCSTEGKDEYCSNRPAKNLNECIVTARATEKFIRNAPFDHTMVLQHMIRRFGDYLWHKDEIPYEPDAKCKRGFSYYSNSITANDTDIDVGSDVDSLIGYQNTDVCSYCVCAVDGRSVGCINRDPWFCEYYRAGRDVENFGRNLYTTLFKQDRPAYFRQLSFRMRRTMDASITEYIEIAGNGKHGFAKIRIVIEIRDQNNSSVNSKIRKSYKTERWDNDDVDDENDANIDDDDDAKTANRGLVRPSCVPFVSEYNDCNSRLSLSEYKENKKKKDAYLKLANRYECSEEMVKKKVKNIRTAFQREHQRIIKAVAATTCSVDITVDAVERMSCKGCTRCSCDADGQWTCHKVLDTCGSSDSQPDTSVGDDEIDVAMNTLLQEIKDSEEEKKRPRQFANLPFKKTKKLVAPSTPLGFQNMEQGVEYEVRSKRSLNKKPHNDSKPGIKFHHTVDEINEDTLKNSNISGTLAVQKVDVYAAKASRRAGVLDNSSQNPLQIVYNEQKVNNHITDNKIEPHVEDKYDALSREKLEKIMGNYTQKTKNKDLSKLVVNELKRGTETIGDNKGPILSNITFTPENDTLTAMAFIAGNLLNKLWNIEKDSKDDSIESELLKHEKIADLLELFKEPMTYRQESFLKDALEKLAAALNKDKDIKSISLCDTVEEIKKELNNSKEGHNVKPCDLSKQNPDSEKVVLVKAVSKIQNVLNLIKKLEGVQKNIEQLKKPENKPSLRNQKTDENKLNLTKDEEGSLDLYGNIMEKVTNLLAPPKSKRGKNKMSDRNIAYDNQDLMTQVKKIFNIDLGNMKMTAKDKMILDYINTMQTNPCMLSKLSDEPLPLRNVESNILLNLSEFFKIKSFSDLLNMVGPEKSKPQTSQPTTIRPLRTTAIEKLLNDSKTNVSTEAKSSNSYSLSLKDKLKTHLKAIINDLIEIQREKGNNLKPSDINIADALPCLVNMFKDDKLLGKSSGNFRNDLVNKVKSVLEMVRKETKKLPQTRRKLSMEPRSTSALIWERVVKNLQRKAKNARRNFKANEPKSYDEVKVLMTRIESESSSTYKNFAFLHKVPAAEKLVLMQALEVDINRYVDALEKLQTLNYEKKLPTGHLDDVLDFVDSAAESIQLNEKVLKNLDFPPKTQTRFRVQKNSEDKETVFSPTTMLRKKVMDILEDTSLKGNENTKLNRDQILNQLIKNRVGLYLKMKEAQGVDLSDDMKYDIAKRIMVNLAYGNHKLAQELFSIFVGNKRSAINTPVLSPFTSSRDTLLDRKQPKVVDSKSTYPDLMLKQFLNMKNS